MSQENVETVKRAIDAFNRRDAEQLLGQTATGFEWFPAMPGIVAGDASGGARESNSTSTRSSHWK